MKTFIQLTTPTGHVFEIPTSVIANNRAAAMLKAHPDEFSDLAAAMADTTGLFDDDSWSIKDWAANNMNWDELKSVAKLVRFNPPTEASWHEGEWSYHDHPALMGELDGEQIMKQPVELVMHTMATSGQLCNVTVLNDINGEPYGAFALMIGNAAVINTYIAGLQFVGEQLTKGAKPAEAIDAPSASH